jgi:serine/threonine protein kinase
MAQRARDYQPGERVPGTVYEIVRLIGSGGMGTVYDVEDTTIGKRYVLKTLHPQLGARDDLARRMQSEARTLARLNHSNIVEVITAGVTGDSARLPYYVMERLNGQSLRAVLEKRGQLELPHALHIGIDLLDALDHAHDKGVIHRDVKPDNIFLHRTSGGVTVTKLLDFGILSLLDATTRETAGRFLGTLRYAAPEQLRGDRPSPKVDLYAAGLVLYEMTAGRGPFDDEANPQAIGAAHLERPPPPLSLFVAVPRDFEALVMGALAKAPDARPKDAFSFASRLRELKRLLGGASLRESTEDRATAAAVIGADSAGAPYVDVRGPLPAGAYVISPAQSREPRGTPAHSQDRNVAQTRFPRTTLPGAAPPMAPLGNETSATTADGIDRAALTNSYAPDTLASPRHGTEEFVQPRSSTARVPSASPPMRAESPFQWPPERAATLSEEPHVQTVLLASRSSRRAALVLAAAALTGVACAVGVVFVSRHSPAPASAGNAPPPPRPTEIATPPPAPPTAWVPPAAVASAQPVPAQSAPASMPTAKQRSVRSDKPRPTATGAAPTAPSGAVVAKLPAPLPDRPGPGF